MKKHFWIAAVLLLGLGFTPLCAQVQFGLSAGTGGLDHFYLSLGNYYNVPQQQVVVIRQRQIPDEQIPVVLFIAQRAHVEPQEVVELREEGFSWMDVALRFGIGPEAFYINVNNASNSPYARPYGYYHRYNQKKWRHIRLTDDDIINYVNLRFLSENYHRTPDEVVRLRGQGHSFMEINEGWRPKEEPRRWDRDDQNRQHPGNDDKGQDHRHHFNDNGNGGDHRDDGNREHPDDGNRDHQDNGDNH
jgi:hypothetical protein